MDINGNLVIYNTIGKSPSAVVAAVKRLPVNQP